VTLILVRPFAVACDCYPFRGSFPAGITIINTAFGEPMIMFEKKLHMNLNSTG